LHVHAAGDTIPQQFTSDALQTITHGRYLLYDVDAVAILIHHPRQAAHLTLDHAQVLLAGRFGAFLHFATFRRAAEPCVEFGLNGR
jgi:hypothetical protein